MHCPLYLALLTAALWCPEEAGKEQSLGAVWPRGVYCRKGVWEPQRCFLSWTSLELPLMGISAPLDLFCKEMYIKGIKTLATGF